MIKTIYYQLNCVCHYLLNVVDRIYCQKEESPESSGVEPDSRLFFFKSYLSREKKIVLNDYILFVKNRKYE